MRLKTLFLLLCSTSWLFAETMYTLRGIQKAYPVVEISGTKLPQSEKAYIVDALKAMTDELKIDTAGYDQRSLALLVGERYAGKAVLIDVKLVVGEQVERLDSGEKVFALTYENAVTFPYDPQTADGKLEDAVDELLEKFADQYREENVAVKRIAEKKGDIASQLGYGTDYAAAVAEAKKAHKNVMLVIVSNYCPWCRKFEEQVLRKQEVNTLVHEKYVPVIVNKEKDAFPAEFNLSFTPIVQFIDPQTQKSYHRIVGYNEREEFLFWLRSDNSGSRK